MTNIVNSQSAFGIIPLKSNLTHDFNSAVIEMVVPISDNVPIFMNDIVKTINSSDEAGDQFGVAYCKKAIHGEAIRGIVISFFPIKEQENLSYRKPFVYRRVKVCQDPFLVCKAMVNDVVLHSDIGRYLDIDNGVGNTITGISEIKLDYATINNPNGQFRISSILEIYDTNDLKYSIVECFIAKHELIPTDVVIPTVNYKSEILTVLADGQTDFNLSTVPIKVISAILNTATYAQEDIDFNISGSDFIWLNPEGITLKTTDTLVVEYFY